MAYKRPRYSEYQDLAEQLKRRARRNNTPCHICRLPIQWDAGWRHPMAFTADHVTAIRDGGDPRGPMLPAHRGCNTRRWNTENAGKTIPQPPTRRSRDW